MSEDRTQAEYFGAAPPFPISRAVRAGDFVITCAMGDRVFTLEEALYDEHGRVVSTGARLQEVTFAEEVHGTFKAVQDLLALAGCTLADVVDCQVWLRDARDFSNVQPDLRRLFRRQPAGPLGLSHRLHVRLSDRDQGHGLQPSLGRRGHQNLLFHCVNVHEGCP